MARVRRQSPDPPLIRSGSAGAYPSEPLELAPIETAGAGAGLAAFGSSTRRILDHLKHVGDASAEEMAAAVGVSVSAVRQQVVPLEHTGLIAHHDERTGPGRPRRRYCLAPASESLWPKRYGQLTNQLLGFIEEADPSAVATAFERRGDERLSRAAARLAGRPFEDRVGRLAEILDEDGYLADCRRLDADRWLITEHNCAILDVAQRYGNACRTELAFIQRALPDARVERVAHMIAGAHVCAYQVERLPDHEPADSHPGERDRPVAIPQPTAG